MRKSFFKHLNRVVLKVGTNLLSENGEICVNKFSKIVHEIVTLKKSVKDVIVVTSGAIGAGYSKMLKTGKPLTIPLKQASASIGQVILMKHYMDLLDANGLVASQVLVTDSGLSDRVRYVNARNTLNTLLQYNVIPIINENDTVAVDEIKFGDNDMLAAIVTSMVDADLLILLSDVDGLYLNYKHPQKRILLNEVHGITPEIENEAHTAGSSFSTGGMKTKLKAAKMVTHHGIPILIANGTKQDIVKKILSGDKEGTFFLPSKAELSNNKKRWIHFNSKAMGKIHIDENAGKAIVENNKSLLPKGITKVDGNFHGYDTVEIVDSSGNIIAKGIANYNYKEVEAIMGRHSSEIEAVLGYRHYNVVIHQNNLVVII